MYGLTSINLTLGPDDRDRVYIEFDDSDGRTSYLNLKRGEFTLEHIARYCLDRALQERIELVLKSRGVVDNIPDEMRKASE